MNGRTKRSLSRLENCHGDMTHTNMAVPCDVYKGPSPGHSLTRDEGAGEGTVEHHTAEAAAPRAKTHSSIEYVTSQKDGQTEKHGYG